jgi:Protein of unknown function (DUF3047)
MTTSPPPTRLPDRRAALIAAASMLAGCAAPPRGSDAAAHDWHDVPLPGKRPTSYRWETFDGQRVLAARAQASASMYRRRLSPAPPTREVEFAWWAQDLPEGGNVGDADALDAAARVMFAFGGDFSRLSARNKLVFELAHSLTGETPPFATLSYVWDVSAPVGRVVVHPRSDRVRKIVVESGPQGLRQWRSYRRRLSDDYRQAFGEAPGPLLAVAVMTDGDNTRSQLTTRYREIQFR